MERTQSIDDRRKLRVETRRLNEWLQVTDTKFKILVVHHPIDWLTEDAEIELRTLIQRHFSLVLSGHIHEANPSGLTNTAGSCLVSIAPALFHAKDFPNGYTYLDIDTATNEIVVHYRTWSPKTHRFVSGTTITGNDTGTFISKSHSSQPTDGSPSGGSTLIHTSVEKPEQFLAEAFTDALRSYASLNDCWVTPHLSENPEHVSETAVSDTIAPIDALKRNKRLILSAPPRFGLTTLGKNLALEYWQTASSLLLAIPSSKMPLYEAECSRLVESFVGRFGLSNSDFGGFIVDLEAVELDKIRRFLKCITERFPDRHIVFLNTQRSMSQLSRPLSETLASNFTEFYVTSLSRSEIRSIVQNQIKSGLNIDENILTNRIVSDIDNINIHRTPFHAKLLLSIAYRYFDITPLNMTEVHTLQLSAAILANMPVGTYDTAPDIKDCCYALGLFCANLIKDDKNQFEKHDFLLTIILYCDEKSIDLDVNLLFECLIREKIIVGYGSAYKFNYIYWVYFFGAHHMITNDEFCQFILTKKNYARYSEMIEYYSGIDRRRTDLIRSLRADLADMNEDFRRRSNISGDATVYNTIHWSPTVKEIDVVSEKLDQIVDETNLPVAVKDSIADKDFNPAKPYRQELRNFIADLSLGTTAHVMVASSKAIRNSDHVDSEEKLVLLREIFTVWKEIIQATLLVSPILVRDKTAVFEDVLFVLDDSYDNYSEDERLMALIEILPAFLSRLSSKDLSTRRTGPLFFNFLDRETDEMFRFFAAMQIIITKPHKWLTHAVKYIDGCHKRSFFLFSLLGQLKRDRLIGYNSTKDAEDLEYLISYIHAKHDLNAKHPSDKLVRRIMNELTFGPPVVDAI